MTAYTFSQCLLDKNVGDDLVIKHSSMSAHSLISFLAFVPQIQHVHFNSEKVLAIVQKVSRSSKRDSSDGSGATVAALGEEDDLSFEEFEEALVAIACHKFPDPYVSLESRLEKFITFYLRDEHHAASTPAQIGTNSGTSSASGVDPLARQASMPVATATASTAPPATRPTPQRAMTMLNKP